MLPDIIRRLPEADIPFDGIRGWLSQADDHQVVFFEIEPVGKVPEHAHGAQWGMVIEGDMDLTIAGETRNYRKGDTYYIPRNVVHAARFNTKTWVIDFFEDNDRYNKK